MVSSAISDCIVCSNTSSDSKVNTSKHFKPNWLSNFGSSNPHAYEVIPMRSLRPIPVPAPTGEGLQFAFGETGRLFNPQRKAHRCSANKYGED